MVYVHYYVYYVRSKLKKMILDILFFGTNKPTTIKNLNRQPHGFGFSNYGAEPGWPGAKAKRPNREDTTGLACVRALPP